METIQKIVGDRVKKLRKQRDLTQLELAKKAKTSVTTINRLEKGRQFPRLETVSDIAKALGTTERELMGEPQLDSPAPEKDNLIVEIVTLLPALNEKQLRTVLSLIDTFEVTPSSDTSQVG